MEEETKSTAPASGNDDSPASDQRQRIIDFGSAVSRSSRGNIYTLTIAGQVEGHQVLPETAKTTKYEHVMPLLSSLEQSEEIEGVLLLLNTVGGDIEAGLGIAELVAGMRKPTVSLVLGGGHSIGVPLAVSAQYSFIAPTATMTVHPVRMNGVMLGVPQTLSYFDKMQERITGFVCQNSRIPPKRFQELMMNSGELVMDIGTVLDGEMAVEEGLIDSLGGLNEAIEKLYQLIESQPDKEEPEDPPAKGAKKAQAPGPKKKPAPAAPGKKSPGRPRKKREAAAALPVMPPLPPTSQAGAEPPPKRRPGRPRKEER